MDSVANIVSLTAIPGLAVNGDCVLIRIRLADGRTAWGECTGLPDSQAAIKTIQQQVAPFLQDHFLPDHPLTSFPDLATICDGLREKITTTHAQPPGVLPAGGGLSRRELITGLLAPEKPQTKQVIETRPLLPAVRFGLSQAILNAVALSRRQTPTAVLAEAYGLPWPDAMVPLHVEVNDTTITAVQPVLGTHVAAFGYSTAGGNPQTMLGADAERLQAHVRQVAAWLAAATPPAKPAITLNLEGATPPARPAIHLNLQGAFTELYGHNEGKILGALYGLEQAAKPYPLVVENVVGGDFTAVRKVMQHLYGYLRLRRMTTQLSAGASLFSPDELRELTAATAVHHIHLNSTQFGSIHETIHFMLTCQAQGMKVTLYADGSGVATAVVMALLTGAQALSGPPDLLYNEMAKIMHTEKQQPKA